MPYPMAHLAVARRLMGHLAVADPAAFYLGSIAPDAYRWFMPEKSAAARARAHMIDEGDPRERIRTRFGGARTDFEAGYALHLLVDLFWDDAVLKPFLKNFGYPVYAHDMGALDVALYVSENAEEAIFPRLATAALRGFDVLISPEQAEKERDLTLSWYRERVARKDEALEGPFSRLELTRAVDEAACFSARAWANLLVIESFGPNKALL